MRIVRVVAVLLVLLSTAAVQEVPAAENICPRAICGTYCKANTWPAYGYCEVNQVNIYSACIEMTGGCMGMENSHCCPPDGLF